MRFGFLRAGSDMSSWPQLSSLWTPPPLRWNDEEVKKLLADVEQGAPTGCYRVHGDTANTIAATSEAPAQAIQPTDHEWHALLGSSGSKNSQPGDEASQEQLGCSMCSCPDLQLMDFKVLSEESDIERANKFLWCDTCVILVEDASCLLRVRIIPCVFRMNDTVDRY
jgi:hypothetical protein